MKSKNFGWMATKSIVYILICLMSIALKTDRIYASGDMDTWGGFDDDTIAVQDYNSDEIGSVPYDADTTAITLEWVDENKAKYRFYIPEDGSYVLNCLYSKEGTGLPGEDGSLHFEKASFGASKSIKRSDYAKSGYYYEDENIKDFTWGDGVYTFIVSETSVKPARVSNYLVLHYIAKDKLPAPQNVRWSDAEKYTIEWDPVEGASEYFVEQAGTYTHDTKLEVEWRLSREETSFSVKALSDDLSVHAHSDSSVPCPEYVYDPLQSPSNLQWSETQKGLATWSPVSGAKSYYVRLYDGDKVVYKNEVDTTNCYFAYAYKEFDTVMSGSSVRFTVRALSPDYRTHSHSPVSEFSKGYSNGPDVKADIGTKFTWEDISYSIIDADSLKVEELPDDGTVKIPEFVVVDGKKIYVTLIGEAACQGNKSVRKLKIPNTVQEIGKNAFKGCKNLASVIIEADSLESIGKNAFKKIKKKAVFHINGNYKEVSKMLKKSGIGGKAKLKKG